MQPAIPSRLGRPATFALIGLLLSAGAPLGLVALRFALRGQLPNGSLLALELRNDPITYLYLGVATACVMTLVGYRVGLYEQKLAALSDRDSLTQLLNRRGYTRALVQAIALARRSGRALTLALIDVDQFKAINDRYGHSCGDQALRQVASCLRDTCRTSDVAFRHGGDEFGLLLMDTTEQAAVKVAERVAQALRDAPAYVPGAAPITLSIGLSQALPDESPDGRALVERADAAMYQAKQAGRDCAMVFAFEEE